MLVVVILMSALLLTLVMAEGNPPYEVDIEDLVEAPGKVQVHIFSLAGYSDYVIQMGNVGDYILLGEMDLSLYDKVTIRYGADGGAVFSDDTKNAKLVLTKNGATITSGYSPVEGVEIIAEVNLIEVDGAWAGGEVEVEMELDTDYSGDVYLAMTMANIGGRQDGVAMSEIIFSDSNYVAPTKEPTPEPSATPVPTDTPEPTATSKPTVAASSDKWLPIVIGIAAALVVVVVVVVIIVKKKK